MALKIKDLQNGRKECLVAFEDGNTMKVIYNPNKISAFNLNMAGEGLDNLCEALSKIITSWDLIDENDKEMESNVDNLKSLNLVLVNKIFETILADAFPKAK
jgi:hypothetical protein